MKFCLKLSYFISTIVAFAFFTPQVLAHDGQLYSTLEDDIGKLSYDTIFIASIILLVLTIFSLKKKKLSSGLKKFLFISICLVTIAQTLFLAGSTIYINTISHSKGPVHYHADFEIFNCGQEVELLDPTGLSNKIGTSTLHEHNDKRIHLEGVVVEEKDQSLGKFFHVIKGRLDDISLSVPTNDGQLELVNGTKCPDGSTGTLNVFVYQVANGYYVQQKLMDPKNYIYAPQSQVPPGDCVIIEFGPLKETTDKLCTSFKVAEEIGKVKNGGYLEN